METTQGTVQALPNVVDEDTVNLFDYLSHLVLSGSCFCCGSQTDLLIEDGARLLAVCPACGAEISGPEISGAEIEPDQNNLTVLQAA